MNFRPGSRQPGPFLSGAQVSRNLRVPQTASCQDRISAQAGSDPQSPTVKPWNAGSEPVAISLSSPSHHNFWKVPLHADPYPRNTSGPATQTESLCGFAERPWLGELHNLMFQMVRVLCSERTPFWKVVCPPQASSRHRFQVSRFRTATGSTRSTISASKYPQAPERRRAAKKSWNQIRQASKNEPRQNRQSPGFLPPSEQLAAMGGHGRQSSHGTGSYPHDATAHAANAGGSRHVKTEPPPMAARPPTLTPAGATHTASVRTRHRGRQAESSPTNSSLTDERPVLPHHDLERPVSHFPHA